MRALQKVACGSTSIGRLIMVLISSWNAFATHDSTNGIKHISPPKIHKQYFNVIKLSGSDMDRFQPCGDQTTHFTSCMETPNVANYVYKGKKAGTTFETRPTICTSLVNEGKTQVGWVVRVRQWV